MSEQPLQGGERRLDQVREHFIIRMATLVGMLAGAAMMDLAGWWYVAAFTGTSFVLAVSFAIWGIWSTL